MPEGIRDAARTDAPWAQASAELPPDPHRLPPPDAWFARDAERHLLDRPRFCPMCGHALDANGITTEYWSADSRNFMTWCGSCRWFGEVVRFGMVVITEAEH
ncbi:MAG: hypothetical protein ACKOE2_17390 [Actinomycetales bacterium]